MGSPSIFAGKFTKLLTNKGILNSDGSLNQFDGPKNYIPYAQFEQGSTTGWSLFNTTLTSGLPTGAVTAGSTSLALTATSTNPLSGSYSMQLAAGTSWTAGHGVISNAFTVDRADLGKVLTFKLYYEATVGPLNANWSGQIGSQSLAIYIYNVTAGAWVQPAGFLGMNQNSGAGYVTGTFQTSVTSGQQYQIAIVALQAVANPLTIVVDQVFVGPQTAPIGTPVTDWQSYIPTIGADSGTPAATVAGKWRRVGDTVEIDATITFSTTSTFSVPRISLPLGMSVDTSKVSENNGDRIIGRANILDAGVAAYSYAHVVYNPTVLSTPISVAYQARVNATSTNTSEPITGGVISGTYPFTFNNGDKIFLNVSLPIQGWSSNVQTSGDTDTRVVAFYAFKNSLAPQSANTAYNFGTAAVDTHGAWNGSTTYTIPVSGWYRLSAQLQFNITASAGQYYNLAFYKGGVAQDTQTKRANGSAMISDCFPYMPVIKYFNAGEAITLAYSATNYSSITASGDASWISIERISGPSVITATESVSASYNISAAASTADVTQFNFDNKQWDTHNAVTTGAGVWKFTAPVSGTYSVSATLYCGGSNTFVGLYKQGSIYRTFAYPLGGTATGAVGTGSTLVQLNAGEYIDVRNITGSARTPATSTGTGSTLANSNYITITRVGN